MESLVLIAIEAVAYVLDIYPWSNYVITYRHSGRTN